MSDDFDNELDWLDNGGDDDSDSSGQDDDLSFDWMTNRDDSGSGDSERTGVTGQLSWQRATGGKDKQNKDDTDELPDIDWEATEDDSGGGRESGRTGVTGQLTWKQEVEEEFERQLDEAEAAARQKDRDEYDPHDAPTQIVPPEGLRKLSDRFIESSASMDDPGDLELPNWMDDPGDAGSDDLPDWMMGMTDDVPDDGEDDDTPDWMATDASDDSGGDDLPDWMVGDFDDDAEDDDFAAEDDELIPDWMRTEDLDEDFEEAEPSFFMEADEEDSEQPDWMTDDAGEADEMPSWMQGASEEEEGEPEIPDWMMEDSETSIEDDVPSDEAMEFPDWMVSEEDEEPEEASVPRRLDTGQLPDWLDVAGDRAEVSASGQEFDDTPQQKEVPDWLTGSGGDSVFDSSAEPSFSMEQPTADDVPDWLTGGGDPSDIGMQPVDDFEEPETQEDDIDLPEWFAGDLDESAAGDEDYFDEESEFDADISFDDSLFDDEEEAEPAADLGDFDLLGELTGGDEDLDLLGEADESDFDLLGELTADSGTGLTGLLGDAGGDLDDLLLGAADDTELDDLLASAGDDDEDDLDSLFDEDGLDLDEEAAEFETGAEDDLDEEEAEAPAADFDFADESMEVPITTGELRSLMGDDEADDADDEQFYNTIETADEVDELFADVDAMDEPLPSTGELEDLFGTDFELEEPVEPEEVRDDLDDLFGDIDITEQPVSTGELNDLFGINDTDDMFAGLGDEEDRTLEGADADFLAELGGPSETPMSDDDLDTLFGGLDDAVPAVQSEEPEEIDLDSFLANLDSGALGLPDTGELSEMDVDFDELFDESELDQFERPSAKKSDMPELSPDAPEWLADLTRNSPASSAAALVSQQKDRPLEELPDRLKSLRERGFELPTPQVTGHTGMLSSVLPGVSGTLPPAEFDPADAGRQVQAGLIFTDEQRQHADLLEAIIGVQVDDDPTLLFEALPELGEQAEARPSAVSRFIAGISFERLSIALILIILMALPFLISDMKIGTLPPGAFSADTRQASFFDQVNNLQPGDLMLVAVEYGPTGASELDTSTQAVLLHGLARGARPVIVGGNPVGLLHVGEIMRDIADQNGLTTNSDYFLGQYLVADVIGLRAYNENLETLIKTDIHGEDTGLKLDSLDQFALIVVMTERSDKLRAWAEQIAPETSTPLIAITGAGAAPLSLPYLDAQDTNEVAGVLVGYEDGYTYSRMVDVLLGVAEPPTLTPTPTDTPEATTPPPTNVPEGVEITEEVTQELLPTATNTPTSTPTSTATPTATPTDTPTATPTFTPTNTPTPTFTPEPVIYGIVVPGGRINIRSGPSTTDAPVSTLGPGDRVLVIGQNEDASWINVLLDDGTEGWVADFLLEIQVVPWDATPVPEDDSGADAGTGKRQAFAKQPSLPTPGGTDTSTEGMPPFLQQTPVEANNSPPFDTNNATPVSGEASALEPPGGNQPPVGNETLDAARTLQAELELTATAGIEMMTAVDLDAESLMQTATAVGSGVALTVEVPAEIIVGPTPTVVDITQFMSRAIVPPETDEKDTRDERWYSMTIGTMMAAAIIAIGSILGIVRNSRQRRRQ